VDNVADALLRLEFSVQHCEVDSGDAMKIVRDNDGLEAEAIPIINENVGGSIEWGGVRLLK